MYPVIVPIRGIHSSKAKLRTEVDESVVSEIVLHLLNKALDSLKESMFYPIVVTSESDLQDVLKRDIVVYIDKGTSLNQAVEEVVEKIDEEYVGLLMPDLPGLTPRSIEKISAVLSVHKQLVVPTYDDGTAFAFLHRSYWTKQFLGSMSSKRILEYAEKRHEQIALLVVQEMIHDIDTPEDLKQWQELTHQR